MMTFGRIAWENLRRRLGLSVFLIGGIAVTVATVVGLVNIIRAMEWDLGDRIDEFGANAILVPRMQDTALDYGESRVEGIILQQAVLRMDRLYRIGESEVAEYINIVSPKLVGSAWAGERRVLIAGIVPQREFAQKYWFRLAAAVDEDALPDLALMQLGWNEVILGSGAAQVLMVGPGDFLNLEGDRFLVRAILEPAGSEEDGLIFANLERTQGLLGRTGELSLVEISAYCNLCPIEEIAEGLEAVLPEIRAIPLKQAALFREETIGRFTLYAYALIALVLVLAMLLILTSLLAAVKARTREIGIFRALGYRRAHVLRIFFWECTGLSVIGGLVGFAIGALASQVAGPSLAGLQSGVAWPADLLLPAVAGAVLLSWTAALYPALKAAWLDPVEALRFV